MSTTTSNGLMRYGHFTSSKRSMDLDEPIYLNLWTASINPSDLPEGLNATADDTNIILEGLKNVNGLDITPGVGSPKVQNYKESERGFAGAKPSKTHLELQMQFEMNIRREGDQNNNYTYKFFRKWFDLIYDPLTGKRTIKQHYICKSMLITLTDKENVPIHQWLIHNIFPMNGLPGYGQLDYGNDNIVQNYSLTFWADTFDDVTT